MTIYYWIRFIDGSFYPGVIDLKDEKKGFKLKTSIFSFMKCWHRADLKGRFNYKKFRSGELLRMEVEPCNISYVSFMLKKS